MFALCGWLIFRPVPLIPLLTLHLTLAVLSLPSFLIHVM
jgi:hypothetical protein